VIHSLRARLPTESISTLNGKRLTVFHVLTGRAFQRATIVVAFLGWLLVTSHEGSASAAMESVCAQLQKQKSDIYGFHPGQISHKEQDAKSSQMDRFWESVKSQGPQGIDCLQQLIVAEQQDGYFAFDAASLLLSLDTSTRSLEVASSGIVKVDLKDVDSSSYIRATLFLLHKGIDITSLVEHYMTAPEVEGFVPQHAMKLDRETGAVFMYGSMPSSLADQSLIRMLNSNESATRNAAVALLSMSLTKDSLTALKAIDRTALPESIRKSVEGGLKCSRIIEDTGPTKQSRAEVLKTLNCIPNFGGDLWGVAGDKEFAQSAIALLQEEDLPVLREARRKSIYGLSDEALHEYYALSLVLLCVINRLDLYKEVREH
jgi:hypothetical protein